MEKKNVARKKILRYMLERESTTKTELASRLNLSMPTVLSNISELTELGLVSEVGETASTGGRKARRIALNPTYCLRPIMWDWCWWILGAMLRTGRG